jgi:hypothetical protein
VLAGLVVRDKHAGGHQLPIAFTIGVRQRKRIQQRIGSIGAGAAADRLRELVHQQSIAGTNGTPRRVDDSAAVTQREVVAHHVVWELALEQNRFVPFADDGAVGRVAARAPMEFEAFPVSGQGRRGRCWLDGRDLGGDRHT